MTDNAPIKKVSNYIDMGMEVEFVAGHTAYAAEMLFSDRYTIMLQQEGLPPYDIRYCDSLQELANAMRDVVSLRKWCKTKWSDYGSNKNNA